LKKVAGYWDSPPSIRRSVLQAQQQIKIIKQPGCCAAGMQRAVHFAPAATLWYAHKNCIQGEYEIKSIYVCRPFRKRQ